MNIKLRTAAFTLSTAMILFLCVSPINAKSINSKFAAKQINRTQSGTVSIAQKVQKKINMDIFYTVFDWVTVKDSSNALLLKGWVHVPWDKEIVEKIALKYSGPLKVKNEIKVALGDENLMRQAVRILYTDSEFENYIFMQNPPIHLVVVNGSIYLYGTVPSVSQKQWAADLLRFGTNAVQVFNHIKVGAQEVS